MDFVQWRLVLSGSRPDQLAGIKGGCHVSHSTARQPLTPHTMLSLLILWLLCLPLWLGAGAVPAGNQENNVGTRDSLPDLVSGHHHHPRL